MPRRGGLLLAVVTLILAWDTAERATGYQLYYGLAPTQYSTVLDVGPLTQVSVGGLDVGQTYYFAATAYNDAGESGPSNEVVCEVWNQKQHACRPGKSAGRGP